MTPETLARAVRVLREAAEIATAGGREFAPIVPGLLLEVLDELERLQAIEGRARLSSSPIARRILGEPS